MVQFSGTFYMVRKGGGFGIVDRNKDRQGDRTVHGSGELRKELGNHDKADGVGAAAAEGLWGNDQIHVLSGPLSRESKDVHP